MTVNLTLNDITAKGATEILKLIQTIETQPTAKTEPIKQEPPRTTVTSAVNGAVSQIAPISVPTATTTVSTVSAQAPVVPVNPTTVPLTAPVVPVQQSNVPNYTIEQLQTAIAPLLDAGKVNQIQALVHSFGVTTLMEIPKERYGEFANGLRNLGGVL